LKKEQKSPSVAGHSIRTIRSIVIDATEEAGDGHPGAAISISPILYALYNDILRVDPGDVSHPLRDRFVLSCGHTVAALYATLRVMGFELTNSDLKSLRRGAACPGHPELGVTPGVELSTGPLGFGFSASLGMALALKLKFENDPLATPRVFVMVSDGDLQEGVSLETVELASQFKLSNLIAIYDSNRITIDGTTSEAWSSSIPQRFRASGWTTIEVNQDENGDVPYSEMSQALRKAEETKSPTLIVVRTTIGYGVPLLAGTSKVHGSVLGPDLASKTRDAVGLSGPAWSYLDDLDRSGGEPASRRLNDHDKAHGNPHDRNVGFSQSTAALLEAVGSLSLDSDEPLRSLNGKICKRMREISRFVLTGSADLTDSTGLSADKDSSEALWPLAFGVREKAMAAAAAGLAKEGFLPIFSTYLAFSDLQRIEIRMAALMRLPSVFVWTHDTFAIGPDGPTHQPVEQLTSLRCVPGFYLLRPGSADEIREVWSRVLVDKVPTGIVLSRGKGFRDSDQKNRIGSAKNGAYVVSDWAEGFDGHRLVLISSGSEVSLCLEAKKLLGPKGLGVRVVSVPSASWFWDEDEVYVHKILGSVDVPRMIVEAGSRDSWWRFATPKTSFLTMDHFGESHSQSALQEKFGFTADSLAAKMIAAM
jgi:transketolase